MNTTPASRAALLRGLTVLTICLLALISAGCQPAPPPATDTLVPTDPPTSTPEPTATATPTDTPTPTATPDRTATAAVLATEEMSARLEEISPELEAVGFTTESGSLIYDSIAPISMTVDSYNVFWPEPVIVDPIKDFILHVDIRWNSTSGLAGCGIIFRAEEDLERGAYYRMDVMRLQAAPVWGMYYIKFNTLQRNLISDRFDKILKDEPNSVNNVVLVVKSDVIQAYINEKKMTEARYSKLSEGGIAFLTWQESGETSCVFKNIWVWELLPNQPTTSS